MSGIRTHYKDLKWLQNGQHNEVKRNLGSWALDENVFCDVHLLLVAGREADPPPESGQPPASSQTPERIRQRIGQRIEHPEPVPVGAERTPEIQDPLFRTVDDDDDDVGDVENVVGQ